MGPDQQRLLPAERANLVAYLDRELKESESQAITAKLSQSPSARRELEAFQKTWDLLDHLPRPEVTSEFTARTLAQLDHLTLPDDRLIRLARQAGHRLAQALVLAVSVSVSLAVGYAICRLAWPDPSSRLIQELSLAEHLDDFRAVHSMTFLRELDQDASFAPEASSLPDDPGYGGSRENEERLREMPRERRLELSRSLASLDHLPRAEQTQIHTFDRQLAEMDEANRARYLAILRQYRLWHRGLPADRQRALDALPIEDAMTFIRQERQANIQDLEGGRAEFLRLQFALLGPVSPFEAAHLLKIWFELPPERRKEIESLRPLERLKQIKELGDRLEIAPRGDFFKNERAAVRRRMSSYPQLLKELEALKDQDSPKSNARAQQIQRLAEAWYFLEHEPKSVSFLNLNRFAAALPRWFLELTDPMPPEAARRRLAILYRLIYPSGTEMPDALPSTPRPADTPSPSPEARPDSSPSPVVVPL